MQNFVVKHNIKIFLYILAVTLLLTSCSMLLSAKTVKIRVAPESVEAGSTILPDGFNFPE